MKILSPFSQFSSFSQPVVALAVALCLLTGMLVWLSYRAALASERAARLLLERRATEQLALLWAGITQDMKGAHATVLVPITPGQLVLEPPYDLAEGFARGFARFSYPESFFVSRGSGNDESLTYVFNRAERPPAWHGSDRFIGPYPVEIVRDPPIFQGVVATAKHHARHQRPFAIFETDLGDVRYQVVVKLFYHAEGRELFGLAGFTVNLAWMRTVYFHDLVRELARIAGGADEIEWAIRDDSTGFVTSTQPPGPEIWAIERSFPVVFLDRSLLPFLPRQDRRPRTWTVRTSFATNSSLLGSALGGTFALVSLAAVASLVGLLVTLRGVHVQSQLTAMKSDFVSSVTHELKRPLAVIRLVAETFVKGRYDSHQTIRDYSQLLSEESAHLTRLVDNLLAYARLTDGGHAYVFEPTDVGDLIDDALDRFHLILMDRKFIVGIDVSPDRLSVRADRLALLIALDNLIDNAIKYSDSTRELRFWARSVDEGRSVSISIVDRGVGIPQRELQHVWEKFYRGRNVRIGGGGLGLTIVRRIVHAHGGWIRIDSSVGKGTRVEVVFPCHERT